MTYKLTTKVLDLVEKLLEEGYCGTVQLSRGGCSGTASVMDEHDCKMWIEIPGFAKETLNLAEDLEDGTITAVGRYQYEGEVETVEDIVRLSWRMFQYYEARGYSMPYEFIGLYEKYGFIEKKVVTKTEVVRKK